MCIEGRSSVIAGVRLEESLKLLTACTLKDLSKRWLVLAFLLNCKMLFLGERRFFVEDNGVQSDLRPQHSGISQGCTLSPLLFIVVMSVVMHDAVQMLPPESRQAYDKGDLADLVYADDTLLIGASSKHLQAFLVAVEKAGKYFGLELHDGKFQLLQIQTNERVRSTNGQDLSSLGSLLYLGSSLSADGRVGSELSRRIGASKADSHTLSKVWRHSSLPRSKRLQIFSALIESRFLYGLASACFTKAELRRIDGFQCKCLRRISGIPTAYYSRVSNATVRERLRHRAATDLLLQAQLLQLGKIINAPVDSPLRTTTFFGNYWTPAVNRFVRRVGRPRAEWIPQVLSEGIRIAGSLENLVGIASEPNSWRCELRRHFM